MDRNLAIEFVRVTEAAAMASSRLMGRGDENGALSASVEAMRRMIDSIECRARVLIGEHDVAGLEPGIEIGSGIGPEIELALNPLEGARVCATGGYCTILFCIFTLDLIQRRRSFKAIYGIVDGIYCSVVCTSNCRIYFSSKSNFCSKFGT